MATYQITATIEKIDFKRTDVELQLKGSGKWFFENDSKAGYNILEFIGKTEDSKFLELKKPFCLKNSQEALINSSLSQAFIENKRLKFEIEDGNNKYDITSISKAD